MKITKQDLIDMGCDPDYVEDWLEFRKLKKKPVTSSVIKRMTTEATKAGITLADAVQMCAEHPWIGFKAEYMPTPRNANGQPLTPRQQMATALRNIHDTNW